MKINHDYMLDYMFISSLYVNNRLWREGYTMKKDTRPADVILEERRQRAIVYARRWHEKKKIAKYKRVIAEYETRQEANRG